MKATKKIFDDTTGFYNPHKTFDDNFDNGPFIPEDFTAYKNQGEPKYSFLGFPVYSPFGIPAGTLPTSKHLKLAFDAGFDVNVYKTMRSVDFEVNEFPNIVYLDLDEDLTLAQAEKGIVGKDEPINELEKSSVTNSFGNPGRGPEFWVNDFKHATHYEGKGQLLIMGVVGTIKPGFSDDDYFNDFAETARLAKDAGAKVVEVNLSCPNVASEGVLCYNRVADLEVAKRCKQAIGDTPMILKLGYFSEDQQVLLESIIKDVSPYASAISAINTIPAAIYNEDGNQKLPGQGRLKAGVCGAGIKWAGLDMVRRLDEIRKKNDYKYEIVGVGGVMNADDFIQYRKAGANLVQSATASMWNINLATEIKDKLRLIKQN